MPQAASAAAAAPTLAGVAAAICLSPQTPAQAATLPASHTAGQQSGHTITIPAGLRRPPSAVELLAASRDAVKQKADAAVHYTVRPGDTLSSIAGQFYHNPAAWPVIYWGNRDTLRWANIIDVGQVLRIPAEPAHVPSAPRELAPPVHTASYAPRHAAPAAPVQADPVSQSSPVQTDGYYSGAYPGGAFGSCVVARESGGDPQIWNASGHYGLYQFAYSTWVAYGGVPSEFGDATVPEQNAVFATALAEGGEDNWAPYDGC
jgi:LysM repeat protein